METIRTLTDEKFQEIYTDKKFRNQVAYAHECWSASPNSTFEYKKTCSYPNSWIVTDEQIDLATKEIERSRKETQETHKNSLLFIGMGMTYETNTEIGNYRIRTEFLNKDGNRFFVELGMTADHLSTRCAHSIKYDGDEATNNFSNLERGYNLRKGLCDYTPKSVMELVNHVFDCKFTEIFIDNYDLSCDGVMCESPN
jgi:hypothetical protein